MQWRASVFFQTILPFLFVEDDVRRWQVFYVLLSFIFLTCAMEHTLFPQMLIDNRQHKTVFLHLANKLSLGFVWQFHFASSQLRIKQPSPSCKALNHKRSLLPLHLLDCLTQCPLRLITVTALGRWCSLGLFPLLHTFVPFCGCWVNGTTSAAGFGRKRLVLLLRYAFGC